MNLEQKIYKAQKEVQSIKEKYLINTVLNNTSIKNITTENLKRHKIVCNVFKRYGVAYLPFVSSLNKNILMDETITITRNNKLLANSINIQVVIKRGKVSIKVK